MDFAAWMGEMLDVVTRISVAVSARGHSLATLSYLLFLYMDIHASQRATGINYINIYACSHHLLKTSYPLGLGQKRL